MMIIGNKRSLINERNDIRKDNRRIKFNDKGKR